ncbi:MAG: hypothetical protein GX046_01900 [Tissierellia bacterium]|jgi:predicted AAA+ superfamily ATPase|nr:hypothetical protein [Tissierellia bacterium]
MKKYGVEDVYFYEHKLEVDFYIPKVSLLVQSSYLLSNIQTREREIEHE